MQTSPSFESMDALHIFLVKSSKQQFQEHLPFFSITELADSLTLLQSQPGPESHHKLEDLFKFIDSPTTLENVGKHFSSPLFVRFLDFLIRNPNYQSRLNSILIGLSHSTFSKSLHDLQNEHLHILRQEGLLEPLHYQLTQFIHEGEDLRESIEMKVRQFKQELLFISPIELNHRTLQSLTSSINHLRDLLIDYLEKASTALAIIWHTDRIDLIEKLSAINESIQHELSQFIGHPAFDNLAPTGLYLFLEKKLSHIFDSSLKDDDSAIEGMTRLGIWHLKDYWELGLLPSISHVDDLSLSDQKLQEKKMEEEYKNLILTIQQQLQKLGVEKVKDLKKHHLYSKSLLKSYIDEHRHLLEPIQYL